MELTGRWDFELMREFFEMFGSSDRLRWIGTGALEGCKDVIWTEKKKVTRLLNEVSEEEWEFVKKGEEKGKGFARRVRVVS